MSFGSRRVWCTSALAAVLVVTADAARASDDEAVEHLVSLSIDDLANVEVYSVSKSAEPLADAPAAIFVITREDIRRSGALTLPEILRLAPNLQVARVSGSGYAITARGFNGTTTTNGAGNKLLVLIDGRSVYTPLYAGVFWDLQYVLPEDIERIEVISGPGATLWGANAVNGVINIVTRSSSAAPGLFASAVGGTFENQLAARYGGRLDDDKTLRVYGMGYWRRGDETESGADLHDGWDKYQGGFRFDWTPGGDTVTVQGDIFRGNEDQMTGPSAVIEGHNLLARWNKDLGNSGLQVQVYYDYHTLYIPHSLGDEMWTYDIDVQHSFAWGERQEIVWGGGFRRFRSHFDNAAGTEFHPATTGHNLGNFFVQDTIAISDAVKLTLGTKFEDDPFVGIEILPSGRLSWKTPDGTLLWASVSRAVRAPSLWDRDLHQIVDGFTFLAGGRFKSETVVAYEAGYRGQPLENLTLSVSAYYNVYDRLRSVEFSPGPAFPLVYANLVEGDVYGVEIWGTWQVMENWRVSAGANLMHQDLRFKKGSFQLTGFEILGNDPDEQYFLRSSWSFAPGFDFDIDARYVAELPNPHVPSYVGLNARLAYHVNERIDVVLRGENLAGAHREFGPFATAPEFEPAAFLALEWRS